METWCFCGDVVWYGGVVWRHGASVVVWYGSVVWRHGASVVMWCGVM